MNGDQRPGLYFTNAPDHPNLCLLRMFESIFWLDAGKLIIIYYRLIYSEDLLRRFDDNSEIIFSSSP